MRFTLFGMVTVVKFAQQEKASLPISVTPSGIEAAPPCPTSSYTVI